MRITKIYWKRFRTPVAMASGVLLGVALTASMAFASVYHDLKKEKLALAVPRKLNVASSMPLPVIGPSPSDLFFDRLKQLRIAGSSNINGIYRYRFRDDSNKAGSAYLSSQDLAYSDVQVIGFNSCQAKITYNNKHAIVYCL